MTRLAEVEAQGTRVLSDVGRTKYMSKKIPTINEIVAVKDDIFDLLYRESDRGCILVSASVLDDALAAVIKHSIINKPLLTKKKTQELFNYTGAIGTFSSKIAVSYLLGLIPDWIYQNLEIIRGIRNDFAHGYDLKDFNNPELCERIKSFDCPGFDVESMTEPYRQKGNMLDEKGNIIPESRTVFICHVINLFGTFTTLNEKIIANNRAIDAHD